MNINNFGLLNSLYTIINNGEADNDYAVATYILHHLDNLKAITVNEITTQSYTTPSAVRRFCQRIGYDNFSEFKASVSKIIFPSNLMYREFIPTATYRKIRQQEINEMLTDINHVFTDKKITELATEIKLAEQVVLVCANNTSGDLIRFQQELLFANKIVYLVSDVYKANNIMQNLTDQTLMIVVSASGTFATEGNTWLQEQAGKKILMTGNRNELFASTYEKIYYISQKHIDNDLSGIYGKYGITYILDLIAEAYFIQTRPKSSFKL